MLHIIGNGTSFGRFISIYSTLLPHYLTVKGQVSEHIVGVVVPSCIFLFDVQLVIFGALF